MNYDTDTNVHAIQCVSAYNASKVTSSLKWFKASLNSVALNTIENRITQIRKQFMKW